MVHPHHIVLAGAGATLYLHPGLAIANQLIERLPEAHVTFVGAGQPAERHAVRAAGFHYVSVPSQAAPENAFEAVRFITDNVAGYWASRWLLRERAVSLVVGLGGYASAATLRAAIAKGIPTVLLEQNVVPGRATRWLAPSTTAVCTGFSESQQYFGAQVSLRVTGNPAHPAFEQLHRKRHAPSTASDSTQATTDSATRSDDCTRHFVDLELDHELASDSTTRDPRLPRRLLVLGGDCGARSLNRHMALALARLAQRVELGAWQVIHQSGEGQLQQTIEHYKRAGIEALVVSFIDDLAPVMFSSDLVVCRATGTTLAEVALAGVPAVLVPHPHSPEGYQRANAELYASRGAARLIDEVELVDPLDDALADAIEPLLVDDKLRAAMAGAILRLARPDASSEIAAVIDGILSAPTCSMVA